MALNRCKECTAEISSKADKCPQCGAPQPKSTSPLTWLVTIIVGMIFIAALTRDPPSAPQSSRTAQTAKDQALAQLKLTFSWTPGGFDNVLILKHLTLHNTSPHPVKDIHLACTLYARSETALGTLSKTLYDTLPAGKTLTLAEFNMGFMHTQTHTVACRVADLDLTH